MEADKSQDLQSASWKPRRANGVVQVQVQKPESQEGQWSCSSPKPSRFETQEELMFQFDSKR